MLKDRLLAIGKRSEWIVLTIALSSFLAWFAYRFYEHGGMNVGHIAYANNIDSGKDFILEPGLFWFNSFLRKLLGLSVKQSLIYLATIHVPLILIVIMWALKLLEREPINPFIVLICAVAVMFASPIGWPSLDPAIYNFIRRTRDTVLWRSATHTVVIPYVVASFALLATVIQQLAATGVLNKKMAVAGGALLLISSLIKPSFSVSIIPAIGLYTLFNKNLSWRQRIQIACILLPTAIVLLGQIIIGMAYNPFNPERAHISVALAPFDTLRRNNNDPFLALLLALLFPLMVLLYRRACFGIPTIIAWINFLVATLPFALLSMGDGVSWEYRDLEWGYLQARQIVFLCSTIEWWKWVKDKRADHPDSFFVFGGEHVAAILLAAHAGFGMARLILIDTAKLIKTLGLFP